MKVKSLSFLLFFQGSKCTASCKGGEGIFREINYTLRCEKTSDGKLNFRREETNKLIKKEDLKDLSLCDCDVMPIDLSSVYKCRKEGQTVDVSKEAPLHTICR